MAYTDQDKLLALSGIYQAASCVQQIARHGSVDTEAMEPCIYSLFQTDADSVPEIFGTPGSLSPGVKELLGQLTGKQRREMELTRYAISLLRLERALLRRREMVETVASGIEAARAKLEHFPMLHPNLLAHLADLYSRTISRLQPRIMVQGDPRFLQIPDNQNRIRSLLLAGIRKKQRADSVLVVGNLEKTRVALNRIRSLLLAGIRSSWLWRQVGGNRWEILFGRKRLLASARDYLRLSQH